MLRLNTQLEMFHGRFGGASYGVLPYTEPLAELFLAQLGVSSLGQLATWMRRESTAGSPATWRE